ncbi:MAG: type II/IV secretion system protein [Planctomycetes bacterium]|nr:type II/IV secretion system protein [Planctomycetota bacterium]NOG53076.1 Flp pilus assembly complex ATPase component TadA [Planctomycetota bacterium]
MGIGSILVERGIISREQLQEALSAQTESGERLDRVLVRLGHCSQRQVLHAIGEQFAMPIVDLTEVKPDSEVLKSLPAQMVYKQNCVPIARDDGTLRIATSDPFELSAFDELRLLTGCAIELVLADEHDLHSFIRAHYGVAGDTLDALSTDFDLDAQQQRNASSSTSKHTEDQIAEDELEAAQQASVIKLVNDLLIEAIAERATDIHIEPYERSLEVRYRVDGVLYKPGVPASINRFRNAIVSRIKIMASMNIAEKRKPQDGRITLRHKGNEYDLRVSIIPMIFGEGVVMRILDKSAVLFGLPDLGMSSGVLVGWEALIEQPHGILLVTGPTGSGKSTTLYASLNQIVSEEIKAVTVEDPVEYNLHGVNQIPVNHKIGLTFAAGLRSILRHDPDVVMVGEIRDLETAETAIQASLTGHLVFSTLHTNDAPSATTRLLDMGVESYLVASSIEGVLAQRLVRRLCPECCTELPEPPAGLPRDVAGRIGASYVAEGCRECRQTGFRGRIGLFELFSIDDHTRDMIMARENASRVAQDAAKRGTLIRLIEDGIIKVGEGTTCISEVLRACKS